MAQGLGSAVGVPTMNHYFAGFMLFFASFLLVMADRYKAHLQAIKKHKEHLGKFTRDLQSFCKNPDLLSHILPKLGSKFSFLSSADHRVCQKVVRVCSKPILI